MNDTVDLDRLDSSLRTWRVRDPLLRQALAMNAGEEARHKLVLNRLVKSYRIHLAPEPAYPTPVCPRTNVAWPATMGACCGP